MAARLNTPAKATTAPAPAGLPEAWGTAPVETLKARDLTDKNDLVGVPFLITGIEREANDSRDYVVLFVTAMDEHGTVFQFSDTSTTGVKAQLEKHLVESGREIPTANTGDRVEVRIPIMKGLRVSKFEAMVKIPASGTKPERTVKKDAFTFYLTGSMDA